MNPTFTIKLDQQVLPGLVTCGKFDGSAPSIACATTGGKILIHSPHETANDQGQLNSIRYLNLNRKITSLAAGSLAKPDASHRPDFLYVGSQSNLLGYDVERNADAFFVDVQDGVHSLVIGKLRSSPKPLVIAGGNCSVLGFDEKGVESFWTVTGDNVSAMALCDLNSNNEPLLLVGSDDFEIRVFQHEELLHEITEADKVTLLSPIGNTSKFAYGLANGTVGVYTGVNNRLWRVKTKNKVTALESYDLDMDGVPEIFSGWDNGTFTVRREENGEVVFRQTMDAPIAGILKADYRMDGKEEVMICSEAGEIRAYLASEVDLTTVAGNGLAAVGRDNSADQKALAELQTQKLELLAEMKLVERAVKMNTTKEVPVGMLPSNTALTYVLEGDQKLGAVALRVEVNTDCQIINLIAVDLEGVVLVDREVLAVSPRAQSRTAVLPLRPVKYSPCTLRVQTHLASRSLGTLLHVFETTIPLPRFAAFKFLESTADYRMPTSKVTFALKDSLDRMLSWAQTSFLTPRLLKNPDGNQKLCFVSVCGLSASGDLNSPGQYAVPSTENTGEVLIVNIQNVTEGGQSHLRVRLQCESMDLAAELIQDLVRYFKLDELQSEADFPADLQAFEEVVRKVADCNAARVSLAADMADDSQRIKALVIRAEDARLMNDMTTMRRAYTELNALNGQLIAGYNVRSQNQAALLTGLKEVNQMIQRAANLRTGKAKARVVSDCRAAVKANNMQSLYRIIQQGYDPSIAQSSSSATSSAKPKLRN